MARTDRIRPVAAASGSRPSGARRQRLAEATVEELRQVEASSRHCHARCRRTAAAASGSRLGS
jgi:hypothetical protein